MTVFSRLPNSSSFLMTVLRSAGSRSLVTVVRSRSRSRYSRDSPTAGATWTNPHANIVCECRRRNSSEYRCREYKPLHLLLLRGVRDNFWALRAFRQKQHVVTFAQDTCVTE